MMEPSWLASGTEEGKVRIIEHIHDGGLFGGLLLILETLLGETGCFRRLHSIALVARLFLIVGRKAR